MSTSIKIQQSSTCHTICGYNDIGSLVCLGFDEASNQYYVKTDILNSNMHKYINKLNMESYFINNIIMYYLLLLNKYK